MPAFNHIAFNCANPSAQEAFYTKHFGFKRSRTFHRGEPGEFFMLKLGSVRLELFPTDPAKTAGIKGGEQPVGFKHLALDVPQLEPYLEALRADGIQPDSIIELPELLPGFRIVFFRDPEGNIIELMEGYRDEE
ncbi:MAG: VOC family protein [Methylacidiphilales bacterium]|nr:VOC family protein [Candidatus Methylacidiphilales bacterium]